MGGALNAAEPRGRAVPAYWAARAQRLRVLRSPGPHVRWTPAPPRPGSPGCLSPSKAGHCRPSAPRSTALRSAKAHLCLRINVTSCLASPSHRLRSVQRSASEPGHGARTSPSPRGQRDAVRSTDRAGRRGSGDRGCERLTRPAEVTGAHACPRHADDPRVPD